MKVAFANNKLARCYASKSLAIRTWGDVAGRRYVLRVDQIIAARNLGDLFTLPGARFHPLQDDKRFEGHYAMNLDRRWRIHVIPSADEDEAVIWGVTRHYGD